MRVIVDKDTWIPTPDGAACAADIYRPEDEHSHPVLLDRSVYGKEGLLDDAVDH
jgi:predicted acyl esterase